MSETLPAFLHAAAPRRAEAPHTNRRLTNVQPQNHEGTPTCAGVLARVPSTGGRRVVAAVSSAPLRDNETQFLRELCVSAVETKLRCQLS